MRTPGGELRRLRDGLHVTQVQLAAAIGCSPVTLGNAETGLRLPFRPFWQRADGMTGACGKLLRLFEAGPEPELTWPAWNDDPAP